MSHLTKEEIYALQRSDLDRSTPFLIQYVSQTQFSIARHCGGLTFNRRHYLYVPPTDELIRDDVVKWLAKHRKAQKNVDKSKADEQDLFNGA